MPANALVVLTKVPEPGESKTRLVPPLSATEAAELARALLIDQLNNLSNFTAARLFIAFAPPEAGAFFAAFTAGDFTCFPQQGRTLGERMRNVFQQLFTDGFNNVVLIGADLPVIPLAFFRQAYEWLERGKVDVVLGPSQDGGYYLAGMSRLVPDMFEGITWSREDVLARTLEKLERLKWKYELLPLRYDIDTADDLERLSQETPEAGMMKNTLAVLNALKRTGRL
jgi:rSAM/selenodomain-associated transferase 1